jgi:hypothetical protein
MKCNQFTEKMRRGVHESITKPRVFICEYLATTKCLDILCKHADVPRRKDRQPVMQSGNRRWANIRHALAVHRYESKMMRVVDVKIREGARVITQRGRVFSLKRLAWLVRCIRCVPNGAFVC